MARPNLFKFATSELSQDAFVCWLLSWADPEYADQNAELHGAGLRFLAALFERGGFPCPTPIKKIQVTRQHQNTDILVIVNDAVPLLIEDKTHTSDHSNQLARYRDVVKAAFKTSEFPSIYLKTGDQCGYAAVEEAGYGVFRREDLLEILRSGLREGVKDQIFLDFHDHLAERHASVLAFGSIPPEQWNRDCWTGFFIELQERLGAGTWSYVSNPAGGFMGFRWHRRENKYLQLEERKLCFKIEVQEKGMQGEQRSAWYERLAAAGTNAEISITKPRRFKRGTWMTAAIMSNDYRQCGEDGLLDFVATVKVLREAERLMDAAS